MAIKLYNGTSDLYNHLNLFPSHMLVQEGSDVMVLSLLGYTRWALQKVVFQPPTSLYSQLGRTKDMIPCILYTPEAPPEVLDDLDKYQAKSR